MGYILKAYFLILLLFSVFALSASTLPVLKLVPYQKNASVQEYLRVLPSNNDELSFDSVQKISFDSFISFQQYIPELRRNTSYWVVLNVENTSRDVLNGVFIAGITQFIDFYEVSDSGVYLKKEYGYAVADAKKEYSEVVSEVVGITLQPKQSKVLYFRFKSELNLKPSPLFKYSDKFQYKDHLQKFNLLQGVFHGMFWMMIAYILFLFVNIRDRAYLYYILYSVAISIAVFVLIGYPRHYIFRNTTFNVLYSEWILLISSVFYTLLFRKILDVKKLSKKWNSFFAFVIALSIIGVITTFCCLFISFYWYNLLCQIYTFIELLIYLIFIFGLFRFKNSETKYYFIGIVFLSLGALTITIGLLFLHEPFLLYFPYFQIGLVFELLFFAFGLSKRFQHVEKQKRVAQQKLILELKDKESLQKQINDDLEDLVAERTMQISKSKQEIERQRTSLEIKHAQLEESTAKLTDNLKYAGFIQNALLDDIFSYAPLFKDIFVLYKPHSFVSGDFYKFFELSDNRVIVVIADCTGHGVPGAILTIIAQDFIQDIVERDEIIEPSAILSALEEKIKTRLLHVPENKSLSEGLDAAIILIDKNRKTYTYAGAKLPLLHVTNGVLSRIRGSMYGIGGELYINNRVKEFKQVSIAYTSGDSIFLSTDGYLDQLNDVNKKFMSRQFHALIEKIYGETCSKQQLSLYDAHLKWKGNVHQTDDILLIGIKL